MEEIQLQALENFKNNMEFLKTNDSELHQKVSILQNAIENGQYRENYALEYIDGCFDVKSLHDNSYLYNDATYAQKKADEVVFDKNTASLSLNYRFNWAKMTKDECEGFSAVNSSLITRAPIEYEVTQNGGRANEIKRIFKFAFLGVGLGRHVESIHKKINADSYLFVEDNLEIFYLSLFVTQYHKIANDAMLFFSVMNPQDKFKGVFDRFLTDMWVRNDFLKFSLLSDAYAPKITQMQGFATARGNQVYPSHLLLRKNIRISHVLTKGYKFLDISHIHETSPIAEKKVLYLAAGPSLSKHIKWVKEHRDEFFIVAVFMISAKLKNEGIKPDVFVHIDENEAPIHRTLKKFGEDFSYFDGVSFIFSASVPMNMFEKITNKEHIYLTEDRTRYKVGYGFLDFYSVGEAGYALCLFLGAKELYLLGLDLALSSGGATHAEGHSSSAKKVDMEKLDKVEKVGSLKDSVYNVAGNRGDQVPTTPLFAISISGINIYTKDLANKGQKIYNLSDGAYFEGVVPLNVEDVQFKNDKVVEDFGSFLDEISTSELTKEEENNLTTRRQEIRKKIKIIKNFSNIKIKNIRDFYNGYITLAKELIAAPNAQTTENTEIFGAFLEHVSPFVAEYLNTKNADFDPKKLLKLRNIVSMQLRKLIAGFGYMGFGYVEPHAYFKPTICKELEDKTLDMKLDNKEYPQAKEICFEEMLKADLDGELLKNIEIVPLEEKTGVGFLATSQNLLDAEYVEYLKKILTTLEEATLVAFYLEKYQLDMAKEIFEEFGDRVEFKRVDDIGNIVNGCRVFINNEHMLYSLDFRISRFIIYTKKLTDIASINIDIGLNEKSIKEWDEINKVFFDYYKILGFDIDKETKRSFTQITHNAFMSKIEHVSETIDENMTLWDYTLNKIIFYMYKSDDFIREIKRFQAAYGECIGFGHTDIKLNYSDILSR